MSKTVSLRQMAQIVAAADDRPPEDEAFLHNLFRGWSQRDVLQGERGGGGKTTAKRYALEEVCIARVLSIFREFFGMDGEELREFISLYRHTNVGPGPLESQIRDSFTEAVNGVAQGERWTLEAYAARLRGSGYSRLRVKITRTERVRREQPDAGLIHCAYLQIDLTAVLHPVICGFRNA